MTDRVIKIRAHLVRVEDEFGQTSIKVMREDEIETLPECTIIDQSDRIADMQGLVRANYRQRLRGTRQKTGSASTGRLVEK